MTTAAMCPVAIVMISLNEAHNLEHVLDNVQGWASEIFLVDSYSTDNTIEIALRRGVYVVQRKFRGFGDQWNFALRELPISAPWTMKLDPDERLTNELKESIARAIRDNDFDALGFERKLWFMGKPLPIRQTVLRVWRTGTCQFSGVLVNEHPRVQGRIGHVAGGLEHHDSPSLEHWIEKQNRYTTAEAISAFRGRELSDVSKFFGSRLQRRMWIKRHFYKVPFRYPAIFFFHFLVQGAWRAGRVGYIWARLRTEVYRIREYKLLEMKLQGRELASMPSRAGMPDPRVHQSD